MDVTKGDYVIQVRSVGTEIRAGRVRSPACGLSLLLACHCANRVGGTSLGDSHGGAVLWLGQRSWRSYDLSLRTGPLPIMCLWASHLKKVCFFK